MVSVKSKILNYYHKDCLDGSSSACALIKKFGENVKCIALSHEYAISEIVNEITNNEYEEIYFTDFCLKEEDMKKVLSVYTNPVKVIDHHDGVETYLKLLENKFNNFTYIFDNNKSGAMLTWEYFFKEYEIPETIKRVQDRDIWAWKIEDTKYVTSYLMQFIPDLNVLLKELYDLYNCIKNGKILTDHDETIKNKIYELISEGPLMLKVENLPDLKIFNSNLYTSELGNLISKLNNEPVGIYNIRNRIIYISIRSIEGQSNYAQQYAQTLGGNGHKHASGCRINLIDFLQKIH